MADPLSVAGSIAGLISVGDAVFRRIYHYVKDVKDAEQTILELKSEVAALTGILHNLHIVAQDLEDSPLTNAIRVDHVKSCLATLYKLDGALKRAESPKDCSFRSTIRKLQWPYKIAETKEICDEIRRHRETLSLALSADSMLALLRCLSLEEDILGRVQSLQLQIRRKEDIETRINMTNHRANVLRFFQVTDPHTSFRASVDIRHPTTGFWLTESDNFRSWIREPGAKLWLSGIPGAGKTVLAGLVIEECMAATKADSAMAYFYCNFKDDRTHRIVNILSTFATQLARQNERSFIILEEYLKSLHPRDQLARQPVPKELVIVLQEMCATYEDVRLVVDGLDECMEKTGEVCQWLRELAFFQGTNISLALLSRNEPEIDNYFGPPACTHIEVAAHTKDIEHYVRTEIEARVTKKSLRLKSVAIKELIVEELVSRADGMFRWVSCQLDHLCDLPTDAQRRKALNQLPKGLYETYERILARVTEPAMPIVQRTLYWITHATPKLDTQELIEAVSIDEKENSLDPDARPDEEEILRCCSSLIRKVAGRLELAHFTVQEYLQSIEPDDSQFHTYRLTPDIPLLLGKTCLRFLCFPEFGINPPVTVDHILSRWQIHPFYKHAILGWQNYLRSGTTVSEPLEELRCLFDPRKTFNFISFIIHYLSSQLGIPGPFSDILKVVSSRTFRPLHAAALLHAPELCQWLLHQGCDINEKSFAGPPVECAVFGLSYTFSQNETNITHRHLYTMQAERTIDVLLAAGANCGLESSHPTSLSYATSHGRTDPSSLFSRLLTHGMPLHDDLLKRIEALGMHSLANDILQIIEKTNLGDAAKLMLMRVAGAKESKLVLPTTSINSMDDESFHGLIMTRIHFDQPELFEDIINDPRFNANMVLPGSDGTVLHLAAKHNALGVMELLLKLGSDPACTNAREGKTVLHQCMNISNDNILQCLISSKAPWVPDHEGRTVWHLAARTGNCRILRLLITRWGGRDIHSILTNCEAGYDPILAAIVAGEEAAALVLLDALDLAEDIIRSSDWISYCIAFGLYDVLSRLVEDIPDISVVGNDRISPLYWLTSRTSLQVLDFLLFKGLDPCVQDAHGRTPLHSILEGDKSRCTRLKMVKSIHFVSTAVLERFISPASVSLADTQGHVVWYYYCVEYAPRVLRSEGIEVMLRARKHMDSVLPHEIEELGQRLLAQGALQAYEQQRKQSGLVLLSRAFLDEVHAQSGVTSIYVRAVSQFFQKVISEAHPEIPYYVHAESTRLLLWAVQNNCRDLVAILLEQGADPCRPSSLYNNISAVEASCESGVNFGIFTTLTEHTKPSQLNDSNDQGFAPIHQLCSSSGTNKPSDVLRKLEVLLQHGVDPDLRTKGSRLPPIIVAARRGYSDHVRLLLQYHADTSVSDSTGRGIIASAVASNGVHLIRELSNTFKESADWNRTFGFEVPYGAPSWSLTCTGCNVVHLAATLSTPSILELLKSTGHFASLHEPCTEGLTPLHFAACFNSHENVDWLVEKGASVDATIAGSEMSALHIAMGRGNVEAAHSLIKSGATFIKNKNRDTPDALVPPTHRTIMLAMLQDCDVPPWVCESLRIDMGLKALSQAIYNEDIETCRGIISKTQHLSKPVLMPCGGCSPLILALTEQAWDIVNLFIENGASTAGTTCQGTRRGRWTHGTALSVAVSEPRMNSKLSKLLEISLSHASHWMRLDFPLFHVASKTNAGAIDVLVKHVQDHRDLYRYKPPVMHTNKVQADFGILHRQSLYMSKSAWNINCSEPLRVLLEQKISPGLCVGYDTLVPGGTPLHVACWNANPTAVQKLLSYGAQVDAQDATGKTPLHWAACASCIISAKVLIDHGANTDSRDQNLWTPFLTACAKGSLKMVEALAQHQIEKRATDIAGRNPLHLAAETKDPEVFIYLVEAGWDASQKDCYGLSAIYYGLRNDHLSAYVLMRAINLDSLLLTQDSDYCTARAIGGTQLKRLLRRLPRDILDSILNIEPRKETFLLCYAAKTGNVQDMSVLIKAGIDLEFRSRMCGSALISACLGGQLESVRFLVRHGAKLESSIGDTPINAIQAATGYTHIIDWLLVRRFVEQPMITNVASSPGQTTTPWAGVWHIQIPLLGQYERRPEQSLKEYVMYVHSLRERWQEIIPLAWLPTLHSRLWRPDHTEAPSMATLELDPVHDVPSSYDCVPPEATAQQGDSINVHLQEAQDIEDHIARARELLSSEKIEDLMTNAEELLAGISAPLFPDQTPHDEGTVSVSDPRPVAIPAIFQDMPIIHEEAASSQSLGTPTPSSSALIRPPDPKRLSRRLGSALRRFTKNKKQEK